MFLFSKKIGSTANLVGKTIIKFETLILGFSIFSKANLRLDIKKINEKIVRFKNIYFHINGSRTIGSNVLIWFSDISAYLSRVIFESIKSCIIKFTFYRNLSVLVSPIMSKQETFIRWALRGKGLLTSCPKISILLCALPGEVLE